MAKDDKNVFQDFLIKKIMLNLPADCAHVELSVQNINKSTGSYTGLLVRNLSDNSGPVININDVLEAYENGMEPDKVARIYAPQLAETITEFIRSKAQTRYNSINNWISDYEKVKSRLFVRLLPFEGNEDFFEDKPYQMFEDLAVTCHILVDQREDSMASTTITNQMMSAYGITEEQLFKDAIDNSQLIFPAEINTIEKVLGLGDTSNSYALVISNNTHVNGASVIIYPKVQEMLNILVGDYYIIPSSIHEALILPDNGSVDCKSLLNTVRYVNDYLVAEDERLSDNIYIHNSVDGTIDTIYQDSVYEADQKSQDKTDVKRKYH